MRNLSVARRYARALMDVASEPKAVEKWAEQLEALAQALSSVPELHDLAVNPAYPRTARKGAFERVLAALGVEAGPLQNLVWLLNDRNRLGSIPEIARIFRTEADKRAGRLRGHFTSAVPLPREIVTKLETALERATQKKVILESKVDGRVLGGAKTQVGSVLYDGSLRTQLEELRQQLKER